jgi:hypothetical protein
MKDDGADYTVNEEIHQYMFRFMKYYSLLMDVHDKDVNCDRLH